MSQLIPVDTFDLVVFGATGDLALRKLIPALYHRWRDNQILPDSRIVGVSRTAMSQAKFRTLARESLEKFAPGEPSDPAAWDTFIKRVDYVGLDIKDADADWSSLQAALSDDDRVRLFYLALPPDLFGPVSEALDRAGLVTPTSRIVLEKPIGRDLESAQAINAAVCSVFDESAIFRIDHYLGKETVQNLLVLRFANTLFEPMWNANGIDHVQITVAEDIGAGTRASYYDQAGALRDMVQNHLLQLMCLVAMEAPTDLEADSVRDEKLKILRALRPVTAQSAVDDTVRGQYLAGSCDGEMVPGYTDELGHESETETFVALRAWIDNWRWAGVPFYLRTGKRMEHRRSEIVIQFKPVPHEVVRSEDGTLSQPNRLVLRLQPNEAVRLMLMTKQPGPGGMKLRSAPLNLSYAETFKARYPDAYERLLMAVVRGNLGLFMRRDEVEAAWTWVDGILDAWKGPAGKLATYKAGNDGPREADFMLDRDGRAWFNGDRE